MSDRHEEDPEEGSGLSSRRGAKAYQWAMEAAFSIPIAIGLGYWADSVFGTGPVLLLVGVGLGFTAFVLRLLRIRSLVEDPGDDAGPPSER